MRFFLGFTLRPYIGPTGPLNHSVRHAAWTWETCSHRHQLSSFSFLPFFSFFSSHLFSLYQSIFRAPFSNRGKRCASFDMHQFCTCFGGNLQVDATSLFFFCPQGTNINDDWLITLVNPLSLSKLQIWKVFFHVASAFYHFGRYNSRLILTGVLGLPTDKQLTK